MERCIIVFASSVQPEIAVRTFFISNPSEPKNNSLQEFTFFLGMLI